MTEVAGRGEGGGRLQGLVEVVRPASWPAPKGYANGTITRGRTLHVGGQVGWRPADGVFADGFVPQVEQALRNVLAVVEAAGGGAQDIARLTWYVTDIELYRRSLRDLGPVYRSVLGYHFPAMSLVAVSALVERDALVEIEAVAALE
jgi:enamine deaminase RidA (YjgF/YER057c/UK114 family)